MNSIDMFSKFSDTSTSSQLIPSYSKLTLKHSNDPNLVSKALNLHHLYVGSSLDLANFKDTTAYRSYILSKASKNSTLILEQNILKPLSVDAKYTPTFSSSHNLVNVNFLRKERLYTKLKYSRSPAYDIVSGGSAALLAAFLGFLISEKFGFEMVDSGDFYFLFMYLVFISFSVRPLLITLNSNNPVTSVFSIKPIINFFLNLCYLLFNKFK